MSRMIENPASVGTILINRLIYSINWFSVPSIFFLISSDLQIPISGLGLISSAFLLGVGLFQVPSGVFAVRFGQRTICVAGMAVLSVGALFCGVADELYSIALLRFVCGVGMALFFSPSVTVLTRDFRRGAEGLGVGIYSSVASLGNAIGLFAWALIGEAYGWRFSMLFLGVIGLATTLLILVKVPRDAPTHGMTLPFSDLRRILADRWLLIISCALLGMSIGNNLIGTFVIVYLHSTLGVSTVESGAIGSVVFFMGLFSSPLAGQLYDRVRRVKPLLLASGVAVSIGVAIASIASPLAVLASTIIIGTASGAGFTFAFAAARSDPRISPERGPIALSWVNSVQLFSGFWAPYLFAYTVLSYGYGFAWTLAGAYSFVFLVPMILARPPPPPSDGHLP